MSTLTQTVSPPAPALQKQTAPEISFGSSEGSYRLEPIRPESPAGSDEEIGAQDDDASSNNVVSVQQRWNSPRINIFKLGLAFFAFFNLGMNDASFGALLPSLEAYYDLSYTVVSLIFLLPFAGYTTAALTSARLHQVAGQRGVALLNPILRLLAYTSLCLHPPWPAVLVSVTVCGLGNGFMDAAWNAMVGDLASANELMGLLHGAYGLGATMSPIIATGMTSRWAHLPWYRFFYIMIGTVAVELVLGSWAFWAEDAKAFHRRTGSQKDGRFRGAVKRKETWLCALFLFVYMGIEVTLGGWIVTFMLRVRDASSTFTAGLAATGFWAGLTVGRVTLGFVTGRVGERLAVSVYLALSVGLELVFWLVPNFVVSAVAVAWLGFFIGPLFPAAILAVSKLLPKELHVSAIGLAAAIGGGGGSVLPFAVGAIAQARGVASLEPIALALLVVLLGVWLTFPRFPKHSHES